MAPKKNQEKLAFQRVSITVESIAPDAAEEVRLLDRFIGTELLLRRKQLVESNSELHIKVTVRDIKGVSQASRVWLGSFAGSAKLLADVEVTLNGEKYQMFTIDTEGKGANDSADWWTGYGGSTEDLLKRAAERIVVEILSV